MASAKITLLGEDPVLVIEHVALYNASGPGPLEDLDYFIPLGHRCYGDRHYAHAAALNRIAGAAVTGPNRNPPVL